MTLTKLDYKILHELDHNARVSYSAIAKKLRMSKQAIRARVERLVERKIISFFMMPINMANFGVNPVQVYISLHNASLAEKEEFIAYLLGNIHVPQISLCEGTYEVIFGVSGRSPHEVDVHLSDIYTRFGHLIKSKTLLSFVDTRLFTRDFLLDKPRIPAKVDKGFHKRSFSRVALKELDFRLLSVLSNDPRISLVDLARACSCSVPTAMKRKRNLEKQRIISGYTYMLSADVFVQHYVLFECNVMDESLERRLFSYFAVSPNITFIAKVIGEFDFSLVIEAKNFAEYRAVLDDFKRTFSKDFKRFLPLLVTDIPKLSFMPPLE